MKEFDDIFKKRLRKYESEVPDSIWKNIEQKKNKKRGFLFWWLAGSGLAIAVVLFAWNFNPPSTTEPITLQTQAIKKENNSENIINPKSVIEKEDRVAENENENENEKIEKTATIKKEATNKKTKKNASPINSLKIRTKKSYVSNNKILTQKIEKIKSIEVNKEIEKQLLPINKLELVLVEKVPTISPYVKSINQKIDLPILENTVEEKNEKSQNIYVDFLAGTSIHRQLLTVKNSEFEHYRQSRDSTETERLGYTGSIRISKKWKNGLAIRTGLTYTLINEKFHWEQSPVSRLIIESDTLTAQHGEWIKTTWNRYHFIEIPLLLGYEKEGEKWNMSLSAGPMVNLWAHQRGDFMSPGNRPVRFTKDETGSYPAFKKWTGLSLFASASLNYKINPELNLLIEPYIRHQLTGISQSDYPLKQRFLSGGIMLGLRKKL